jgi:hypothetical protein
LVTYFEDPWVKERDRRTSIEKEIKIQESELYKSTQSSTMPPVLYSTCPVCCAIGTAHSGYLNRHGER